MKVSIGGWDLYLFAILRDLQVLAVLPDSARLHDEASQTQLDRAHDVQVATSVEEGVKQLVRAEKIQKSSRMILCIMFLVVAVILMVLILVLKNIFL